MLGGISGYSLTETTDENPERVAVVQRLTGAYLRSALHVGEPAWRTSWPSGGSAPLHPEGSTSNDSRRRQVPPGARPAASRVITARVPRTGLRA